MPSRRFWTLFWITRHVRGTGNEDRFRSIREAEPCSVCLRRNFQQKVPGLGAARYCGRPCPCLGSLRFELLTRLLAKGGPVGLRRKKRLLDQRTATPTVATAAPAAAAAAMATAIATGIIDTTDVCHGCLKGSRSRRCVPEPEEQLGRGSPKPKNSTRGAAMEARAERCPES